MTAPRPRPSPAEWLAEVESLAEGAERDSAILLGLEDDSPAIRERAIRLATRYLEPEVLGELVADESNAVRRNAALTALERQGPYAVPHLVRMLARPEVDLVMFSLQMLARIGDPTIVSSVVPLVSHPDLNVAQSAIEALGRLRSVQAVSTLLGLLKGDIWLQLAAIDALGEIGDPRAVGPLVRLVPDSVLAEPAVRALQRIAAPDSLAPLLARLPLVREPALRDVLLLAIGVVIDLHPDPLPIALQFSAEWELDPRRDVLDYLEEILQAEEPGGPTTQGEVSQSAGTRDMESLLRAATALTIVAGLRSLFPPILVRIASESGPAWAEGLFRRHPTALSPALGEALQHPDARVRRGGLLAGSFDPEDLARIVAHLDDGSALVRAAACRALGLTGVAKAAPLLIGRLRDGQPVEQAAAVDALAHLPAESLQRLEPCLGPDLPEPVLAGALEVLARRGTGQFEERIVELTRHRSLAVRRGAIRAAARLPGAKAEVVLIRALADRDQAIQIEALDLLVKRDHGKTIPTLSALLGAGDSFRYHVIRALGQMRAVEAVPKLQSLYDQCGPHEQVEIVQALVRMGTTGVADFLRKRLAESEPEIRRLAARGLATVSDRSQLPLLLDLAADADWCVRDEAARGLGLLGLPECRGPLLILARDVEPVVASSARAALGLLPSGDAAAA